MSTYFRSALVMLFVLMATAMSLDAQCPPITNTVNNSSCTAGASLTLLATTYGSQYVGQGVRHRWYTSPTGSSYVQDVAATDNPYAGFTTSSYTANFYSTTSYWVAAYKPGCAMSSRRQVTATINTGSATITPSTTPMGVCSADGITLTANSGTSYQWYRNTVNNISTATQVGTSRTYDPTIDSYYWVKVYSSPCGWTTSSSIHVTFTQALTPSVSITKSPSGSVCPGTSVTLTAVPAGTSNTPTYSWTIGGSNYTTNPVNYTVNSNNSVSLTMTSTDGCVTTSTANASSSLSIYPYPTSGTLQGTGTYCSGSSATLSVANTQSGYKYYLYRGATLVQTVTGTGGTVNFNNQTTEGTYTLKGSHANCTSDKTNLSGSVVVDMLPLTTTSLTSSETPAEACQGAGLKLTATASRTIQSVTWKRGATTVETDNSSPFEYTPNTVGTNTYYAEIYVDNGCGAYSTETESMSVTINAIETLNVTVTGPGSTLCPGTNASFSASVDNGLGGLVDYQWYVNDITKGTNSNSYSSTTLEDDDVVKCTVTLQSPSTCASPSSDSDQETADLYDPESIAALSDLESWRTGEGVLMGITSPQVDMTYYLYELGNATAVDTETYSNRNILTGNVEFDIQSTETTYSAKGSYAECPSLKYDVPGSVNLSHLGYYSPNEIGNYSRSLSSSMNYIRVVTAKDSGYISSILAVTDPHKVSEAVSYSDGIGRTIQTNAIAANPDGLDIVQFQDYDDHGRSPKGYLPYVDLKSTLGKYRDSALIYQTDFYDGTEDYGLTLSHVDTTSHAFGELSFDQAPSNQILEKGTVGTAWQLGDTFDSDGHSDGNTPKSKWETNSSTMNKWMISASGTVYSFADSSFDYQIDELIIKIIEDENGNQTENSYSNDGKLVYSRRFNGATTLETIYVYDKLNRLRCIIPPEASGSYVDTSPEYDQLFESDLLDAFAYQYNYDSKGRLIEKKLPGIEPIYFIYNKRDRLVLSQDGNLRDENKWSFIKYDEINRSILSGIVTKNYTRLVMQDTVDIYEELYLYEERSSSGTHGYTNRSYPDISSSEVNAVNYYDDYEFIDDFFYQDTLFIYHQLNSEYSPVPDYRVYGKPTGGKIKMIGEDKWLQSALYYDKYGRVLSTIRDLYPDGYEISNIKYKFNGQVDKTTLMHTPDDSDIISVTQRFEYDHQGRILEQYHKIDDQDEVLLQAFSYNELGQLVEKNIYCPDSTSFLQSIDYEYNIRGWLTSINEGISDGLDGDLFAQELQYEDPDDFNSDALYNGMISASTWWQANNDTLSAYGYTYDDLYQLKSADFHIKTTSWSDSDAYNVSNLTYDKNGNIESVSRDGTSGTIDNLSYVYSGNQLIAVGDQAADQSGRGDFYDGTDGDSPTEYTYDDNGNLINDSNKGISSITYNFLNLPETIDFGSGDKIIYTYDATGNRWKTTIEESGSVSDSTNYMGGFVYNSGTLSFAQTATGRFVPDGNDFRYDHLLKDHLGSTRVVFSDTDDDGDADILQETHYFPFGLEMPGRSYLSGLDNANLYTGKPIDKQHGLDWYSHGARYYDPQLARWHTMDPLAERNSSYGPYHYVLNNPINFIDPNGMTERPPEIDLDREKAREGRNTINTGYGLKLLGRPNFFSYWDDYWAANSWGFNSVTGQYENSYTGESFDATTDPNKFDDYVLPYVNEHGITFEPLYQESGGIGLDPIVSIRGWEQIELNTVAFTSSNTRTIGEMGDVVGGTTGLLGLTQVGLLENRKFLPIHSKVGSFTKFASAYKGLGFVRKTFGRSGYAFAAVDVAIDYSDMQNGLISPERFAYRTSGTLASVGGAVLIGSACGGPWGAAAGALIGGTFYAGEKFYDDFLIPAWSEMQKTYLNFQNNLGYGWNP